MSQQPENLFLNSLSEQSRSLILSKASYVALPLRTSLYKPEETPGFAYFLTSGITSLVTSSAQGDTAEVGIVGREGLIGAMHILGPARVSTDCFIQIEAAGYKLPLAELRSAFRSSPEIHARVLEFVQYQGIGLAQVAGCHRLHEAEERLARWLLMAQDRTQTEELGLTQDFLAMMLGARRTTVTMVAGALQRSGLIEYHRGKVKILHRENLEAAACECYGTLKELTEELYRDDFQKLGDPVSHM